MVKLQAKSLEIESAVMKFYEALQKIFAGETAMMEEVWSHAEDVTYLGPQGGILVGWEQVFKAWKDQASMGLKGCVEPRDIHFFQEGDIGITQNYEIGSNYVNGKPQTVRIRAVNIFRKEKGIWKMISHQTDLLSYL